MAKKVKTFVLSDGSKNSYGFAIDMAKLNLERFKANPVMLYNHGELVGKWENIRVENGKLLAEPVFMDNVSEEFALKIKSRVDDGFVNGASIGFGVLSVNKDGDIPLVEAEVNECSVVDMPSNANAIVLYDSEGIKLDNEAFKLALNSIKKPIKIDKEMKLNKNSYVTLGLAETATESEVDVAIQNLNAKNVDLQTKVEGIDKAKVDALITVALSEGRFTADKKEQFEQLATANFDLAKSTIEGLPLKGTLAGNEQREKKDKEDREKWTFADWRKKDTAGLLSIKDTDPERYKEITGQ